MLKMHVVAAASRCTVEIIGSGSGSGSDTRNDHNQLDGGGEDAVAQGHRKIRSPIVTSWHTDDNFTLGSAPPCDEKGKAATTKPEHDDQYSTVLTTRTVTLGIQHPRNMQ